MSGCGKLISLHWIRVSFSNHYLLLSSGFSLDLTRISMHYTLHLASVLSFPYQFIFKVVSAGNVGINLQLGLYVVFTQLEEVLGNGCKQSQGAPFPFPRMIIYLRSCHKNYSALLQLKIFPYIVITEEYMITFFERQY